MSCLQKDQREKQEPVTHYIVSDFGGEFDKVKMMPIGRHPLYAAPVASDTDLKAEIGRLRQALKDTLTHLKPHVDSNKQHREPYETALSAYDRGVSALNHTDKEA